MKLKIYKEEKKEEERVVFLKLVENSDGSVSLAAIDENGRNLWWLLQINQNGVNRTSSITDRLGFLLDESGRLKLTGE